MTAELIALSDAKSTEGAQTLARELPHSLKGPMTKKVQRRALLIYMAIASVGMLMALFMESDRLTAFGLGMFFPGAGFIYTGQWIALALTGVLFLVAFALWPASGNMAAAPLVWLGAAAYGAYHAGHPAMSANHGFALWLVPGLVVLLYLYNHISNKSRFEKGLETLKRRNEEYLSKTPFEPIQPPSFDKDYWRELSFDELKETRFLLDRALQPLDKYDGFNWLEYQFQIGAVRYQLCTGVYTLGLMQYHFTPNFQGYLKQAQRNLIDKMLDKRIWGFWRWESLWGNFTTDYDPVKKDNIMVSGWLGMALGHYATTTGDDHYSTPGSLTFRYDDKSFAYDIHSMAKCVYDNHKSSPWTLFPCEPNWNYPMCNEVSMNYLVQYDRLYGTNYYNDIKDDYISSIDTEYTTTDGRSIAVRSTRLGFDSSAYCSLAADGTFAIWANPTKPLRAQRTWAIVRNEYLHENFEGDIELLGTKIWENMDIGTYKPSQISSLSFCAAMAQEHGDSDMAEKILNTAHKNYNYVEKNGVRYCEGGSTIANFTLVQSRMLRKNALAHLVNFSLPETITKGPYLAECEYPKVLVAKAVSFEGNDLELVLYPGTDECVQQIEIARLSPSKKYVLEYPEKKLREKLTSDSDGKLTVNINLDGRTYIRLTPA